VAPDLTLASRDPDALRYAALTALLVAGLFGSLWRIADLRQLPVGAQATTDLGASWEGWAEPPGHTGRPSLYLNSLTADAFELPAGSRILLRLYGAPDALVLRETLTDGSGPAVADDPAAQAAPADPAAQAAPADQRAHDFIVAHSGVLAIDGEGGREWAVSVVLDAPPSVELTGPMNKRADGTMSQPFAAQDDFAIMRGEVRFELDLEAVPRRYGLAADPDPLPALVFDLPLPVTGSRAEIVGAFTEDASMHPWANLPVKMTLFVQDGLGQTGQSAPHALNLPARRFFDPLASAVIEMRRDLMWSADNAPRVSQILRAITHRPEGFIRNKRAYLMLRTAIRRLDTGLAEAPLTADLRSELATALWDAALLIEDGGLDDALERMRQAQERLSEAIRNGASPEEIQKLMDELRAATDQYLTMLAERNEQDPSDRFTKNQPTQNFTEDQLQQMMDEIQKLMEEGRMAEAQELLEQLNQLMENLKVTQSEGGDGKRRGQGGKSMEDLRDTLRDQQNLSDDAFRQGQQSQPGGSPQPGEDAKPGQPGEDANPGQPGQDGGAEQGQGQGQGQGDDGDQGQSLADRQRALRRELERQRQALPDAQGQDADRARRALEGAESAMGEAEQALRDGDIPGAIDRQAEAIQQLHEGMRSLSDALAQDENRLPGNDGQAQTGSNREVPRDPLGRTDGTNGQSGTEEGMLQGADVYRRARDLLDEIRRKSSDPSRSAVELDYLKRLLDRF
ncbi:MAG: DUF4175 family protein, partial [Albidovulum sp.]